jgi:Flp pilus assembly pilin Flp
LARNRRGAALAEHVLLVALVVVGLIGLLFGIQSHLGKIYTKANTQMGIADCAASCSGASSGGGAASSGGSVAGQSGGSGGSAAAGSGSSGTGGGGIVLGVGDETPTNGPDASAGSGAGPGGGSGGSQPQPGIHVPTQ